jgi:plastocyanin
VARLQVLALAGLLALVAATTYAAATPGGPSQSGGHMIVLEDDCDPQDPGWNDVGGCHQPHGDVSRAEFNGEVDSPLADAVIGHQAWRNDPAYLKINVGTPVQVRNGGGRPHTLTEVEDFGGGVVPPLNEGLTLAPECPDSVEILPGGRATLSGLAVGNHRYQCCFHPWMRALIKVEGHGN